MLITKYRTPSKKNPKEIMHTCFLEKINKNLKQFWPNFAQKVWEKHFYFIFMTYAKKIKKFTVSARSYRTLLRWICSHSFEPFRWKMLMIFNNIIRFLYVFERSEKENCKRRSECERFMRRWNHISTIWFFNDFSSYKYLMRRLMDSWKKLRF